MIEDHKPLITFTVTSYNQRDYIREAVQGAFDQTYSPLEIIMSDDCSQDNSYQIMEEMANSYRGPHKIVLNRNEKNLGIAAHTSRIVNLAEGEIIVFADGDDISMPERTQKSYELFAAHRDCFYVNFSIVKFYGRDLKLLPQEKKHYPLIKYAVEELDLVRKFPVSGATAIVKSVFQDFGELLPTTPVQDSPIQLRYLLAGPILKSEDPQIYYRIHGKNLAASHNKYVLDFTRIHQQYVKDLDTALEKKMIDEGVYNKIKLALEGKLTRKLIEAKFFLSNCPLNVYFSSILFSQYFGIKEKLMYVIKFLMGIFDQDQRVPRF